MAVGGRPRFDHRMGDERAQGRRAATRVIGLEGPA